MLDEVAAFNTSALTGESVPRNIRQGGEVLAGMIATDKVVRIQVTKPFEKSALSVYWNWCRMPPSAKRRQNFHP